MYHNGLAWGVLLVFTATVLSDRHAPSLTPGLGAIGWVLFTVFWLTLIPVFSLEMRSPVETLLAILAVLGSGLIAYRFLTTHSQALVQLSSAIAVAGAIYLSAATIPFIRTTLIELVAHHTLALLSVVGVEPTLAPSPSGDVTSALLFTTHNHTYRTYLVFACTGAGTIAVFTGILTAAQTSLRRRLIVLAGVVGIVWVLNIVRNAFIAVAFGHQWFQLYVPSLMALTGYHDPAMISYVIADRLIAQPIALLTVIALLTGTAQLLPSLPATASNLVSIVAGDPAATTDQRDGDSRSQESQ